MDPFTIIALISIALPLIIELIKLIEDQVQKAKDNGTIDAVATTGATKKTEVINLFTQTWTAMQALSPNTKALQTPMDKVIPVIAPLIDQIVAMFNTLGIFKKSTPPKPA